MMDRREALRLLGTGAALQMAPRSVLLVLRQARSVLASPVTLRTLNPHQDATVRSMTELILPKTDTPGAADARANEFSDLMLTEWYDDEDRTRFVNGLAEVDARTKTLFNREFVDASPDQQGEILNWLGEKMLAEAQPGQVEHRRRRGAAQSSSQNFYAMLRYLTLTAYYTSEAGATEELHYEVIPASHQACATIPPTAGGAEKQ